MLELNSKGLHLSFKEELEKSRGVSARKYTKSRDAPAQLLSANLNVLLFYRFCCRRRPGCLSFLL